MNNSRIVCPECKTKLDEEYIRCPTCHAYVLDASPWKGEYSLYAIAGSLVIWVMFSLVTHYFTIPLESVFNDGISNSILILALYGIIILIFKWTILTRQYKAFQIIRQIIAVEGKTTPNLIGRVQEVINANNLGSYNNLIVYQRLSWIEAAKQLDNPAESGMLDAVKQHAETDWDSLETSFAIVQFLIWLLPTAGFLGTVYGMTQALKSFSEVVARGSDLGFSAGLTATAQGLGVAFHTTLVGLATVIPLLALSTFLRRRSQLFLEQIDKFFIRFATESLIVSNVNDISENNEPEETIEPPDTSIETETFDNNPEEQLTNKSFL